MPPGVKRTMVTAKKSVPASAAAKKAPSAVPAAKTATASPDSKKKAVSFAGEKAAVKKEASTKSNTAAAAIAPAATSTEEKKAVATKKPAVVAATGGKKKQKKDKPKMAVGYPALRLRNLPPLFQEPEIKKFLSQFEVKVASSYVVRAKKTGESRGVAYVRFQNPKAADAKTRKERARIEQEVEERMTAILQECDGMLLGDRIVRAAWVAMNRAMPSGHLVRLLRKKDWLRRVVGKTMIRHNGLRIVKPTSTTKKESAEGQLAGKKQAKGEATTTTATLPAGWTATGAAMAKRLAVLLKAIETEKKANTFAASVGVNYSFSGFQEQLKKVPQEAWAAYRQGQHRPASVMKSQKKKETKKKAKAILAAAKSQTTTTAVSAAATASSPSPNSKAPKAVTDDEKSPRVSATSKTLVGRSSTTPAKKKAAAVGSSPSSAKKAVSVAKSASPKGRRTM